MLVANGPHMSTCTRESGLTERSRSADVGTFRIALAIRHTAHVVHAVVSDVLVTPLSLIIPAAAAPMIFTTPMCPMRRWRREADVMFSTTASARARWYTSTGHGVGPQGTRAAVPSLAGSVKMKEPVGNVYTLSNAAKSGQLCAECGAPFQRGRKMVNEVVVGDFFQSVYPRTTALAAVAPLKGGLA